MDFIPQILQTLPGEHGQEQDEMSECLKACVDCAAVCSVCSAACLMEENLGALRQCILLDLNCAKICEATAGVLARRVGLGREILLACAQACRLCADECDKHASMHAHCRVCADACRRAEKACSDFVVTFGATARRAD